MSVTPPKTLYIVAISLDGDTELLNEWLCEHCPYPPVELETPGSTLVWVENYFESEEDALVVLNAVRDSEFPISSCELRPCPEEDWTTFWQHHFQPRVIGKRLVILPEWLRDEPEWNGRDDQRETVLINPGLSFGTGDHFTTRFCLEMLDRLVDQGVHPARCFDAGCGSAILSIAAHKLGWPDILAVDVDPLSIEQAGENLELNGVVSGIDLGTMDLTQTWPEGQFDVVFANLYGGLLMQLAPDLIRICSGTLVLSGIRAVETDAIASLFGDLGAREVRCESDHEWSGFCFQIP